MEKREQLSNPEQLGGRGNQRTERIRVEDGGSRVDELRPTDTSSGEMWKFDPTDVVEQFDTDGGAFRVHFTRAGKNAVPLADPAELYDVVALPGVARPMALGFKNDDITRMIAIDDEGTL